MWRCRIDVITRICFFCWLKYIYFEISIDTPKLLCLEIQQLSTDYLQTSGQPELNFKPKTSSTVA